MLSVRQEDQNQNIAQAPTLGQYGSVLTGQPTGQSRGTVSGRGSGFTNLQSYIQANQDNPNARLIQQRTGQATQAQQQAQTGFGTQAQTAKTGLENIQQQAGIVRSALENPTEFVKTPSNIDRITALRTGQEVIANPRDIQQNILNLSSGLQSQRQSLGQGLQTDITGTGLQEYLRNQRSNPALSTLGENRLDRFLAEQTASGQQSIQAGQTEAQRIQELTQPSDVGDISTLAQNLQSNPLASRAGILQKFGEQQQLGEKELQDINNLYVASQVGLGSEISPEGYSYNPTTNILSSPIYQYSRPSNIGQASTEQINQAKQQYDNYNNFNAQLNKIDQDLANAQQKFKTNTIISQNAGSGMDFATSIGASAEANNARNEIAKIEQQRKDLLAQAPTRTELIPYYQQYLSQLGKTRQQLLSEYDPNKLARLQALQQITGGSYADLLGSKIV